MSLQRGFLHWEYVCWVTSEWVHKPGVCRLGHLKEGSSSGSL